jgi:hypothetical protein
MAMPLVSLFSSLSLLCCMTLLNPSDSIKSTALEKTGEKSMAGSIELELTGALKLSRKLDTQTCRTHESPFASFSVFAVPDEIFEKVQIGFPKFKGAGKYAFTKGNWPIFSSLPISLITMDFRDGSTLYDEAEAEVEFVVDDDEAKSGVVTFKGYRGMQFSQAESDLVDRGEVQGTIRWKCGK